MEIGEKHLEHGAHNAECALSAAEGRVCGVLDSTPRDWSGWIPEGFCFLTEQGFCLSQRNGVHKLTSILDLKVLDMQFQL